MECTIEDINAVQRRIKIAVAPTTVSEAFGAVLRKAQKKAQIRGFRPGKAPLNLVKKLYGDSIAYEVADELIRMHLGKAMDQHNLRPVAQPTLEELVLPKDQETYAFSAVVDIMPQIELGSLDGLKVSVGSYEVDDEFVSQRIEEMRQRQAKTRAVEGEGAVAANGNLVDLKIETKTDGEVYPPLTRDSMQLEVGAGRMWPELEEGLRGVAVGEERQFDLGAPPFVQDENLKQKRFAVTCTIKSINELVLPELNDEFAKDVGFDDLAHMRAEVRSQEEANAKRQQRAETEKGVLEALLERFPFEVPPALVANVIDDIINELPIQDKAMKEKIRADKDARARFLDEAKRRAQNSLLLLEVARKENLEVDDAAVEKRIEAMIPGHVTEASDRSEWRKMLEARFAKGSAREEIIFSVAMDYLIDRAQVTHTKG